jgi:hypothetical protein
MIMSILETVGWAIFVVGLIIFGPWIFIFMKITGKYQPSGGAGTGLGEFATAFFAYVIAGIEVAFISLYFLI